MTKPTIHTNGTGAGQLLEAYTEASGAIRAALDKLSETSPNGRDYYPQDPGALGKAIAEHDSRRTRLRSVMDELDELAEHCLNFVK